MNPTDLDYARAQAMWLAREFPDFKIDANQAVRVQAIYEGGRTWSSVTFEDSSFHFVITYADARTTVFYPECDQEVDLVRMVVEGLELLRPTANA